MNQFSKKGEPVSVFEMQLVAESAIVRADKVSDLWVQIARRIGADKLAVIFDEIGGEKVHVPTRAQFFAALFRPYRNKQILDMRQSTGMSLRELGREFDLSPTTVSAALTETTTGIK